MFGLFKKKSEIELLQKQYRSLLKEHFDLSKINRSASDAKYAQAQQILEKIETLKNK